MFSSPSSLFGMAEVFGVFFLILWIPYILIFAFLPVVLYLVARWRQHRAGVADTDLGLKCGLGLFRVISVQLVLAGGWMFLYSLLADGDNEVLTRTAFGLILPGALVFGAQFLVLSRTNHQFMPMPVRLFRGMEMMQTGVVSVFALVMAFTVTVQDDPPDELLKVVWTLTLVYGTAWGLMIRGLIGDAAGPASQAVAQAAPAAPAAPTPLAPPKSAAE